MCKQFGCRGKADPASAVGAVALEYDACAADYNHVGYNEPDTVLIAQLMGRRPKTPAKGGALSLLIPAKGIHELKRLLDEVRAEKKGDEAGTGTIAVGQGGSNVFLKRDVRSKANPP